MSKPFVFLMHKKTHRITAVGFCLHGTKLTVLN
jgi:hypothetical protein